MNHSLCVTELLGAPGYDREGALGGRVREVALTPQEDRARVSTLIVKTKRGNRLLPWAAIKSVNGGVRALSSVTDWAPDAGVEGLFLLERDLLDQQVIDVNGRKVVRVNDVHLHEEDGDKGVVLKVGSVDVGARGALRRLLKGL